MKKSWQKILAMLCAMMLALTGLLAVSFAEEAPAEDDSAAVMAEVTEVTTEEPVAENVAVDIVTVVEAPAVEVPVQEAAPVAEEPVQVTEAPAAEEPAQTTEVPATEEPVQETEIPTEETDQSPAESTEVPAAENTVPAETPAAVIPAEEVKAEEVPAAELIPADMTLKTLIQGVGTATANKPYIIRLVSNVTGKVEVTLKADSELFVQFGKDGEEISREILPNEEGDISFTFGAEFGKNYLLYVYSIGVDAETGLVIESVPFRISSEKVEPIAEEVPAEESFDEEVPAETADDVAAEEAASEETDLEEAPAEDVVPDADEIPAEDPAAEATVTDEESAAEDPAEEEALIIYEQPDDEEDEEIDEYETALGLYEVKYVITAEETDIRVEADGMSPIMATVPEGTALKGFVTDDGDWMMVVINGELGYAYKKALVSTEEEPVEEAEEAVEEIPEEAGEEAEAAETTEEIPEETTEAAEEAVEEAAEAMAEQKVTIFTSRRVSMTLGEPVYLTSELEGFDGLETVFQWECDKGEGFEPVEGADEDNYSFEASKESLSWMWRLTVRIL